VNDAPAPVPAPPLPPGYPAELEHSWQPAGGPAVLIRPLRPDDLGQELRFIAGLSAQTLYQRLQYSAREVSAQDAARLLETDFVNTLGLAALADEPAGRQIVGVSRYARVLGTDRAECAIVVADRWQGRGLGTELMRSLARAAQARGINTLEGLSLGENARIAQWARRYGLEAHTEPHSGGMLLVSLDLSQLPSAAA